MRDLIRPYLYRLGMDWKWSQRWGALMCRFAFPKCELVVSGNRHQEWPQNVVDEALAARRAMRGPVG